jgi:hypothetical protein
MKKGATPTNYKTVVQQRLIQDIFKTPHQQDDELSGICGLGTNLCKTGVDVVTDAGEVLEANGIVALSAPSNVLCWSVVNRS